MNQQLNLLILRFLYLMRYLVHLLQEVRDLALEVSQMKAGN